VVSVFATAAAAVSAVRPQFPDVRTVTLCSDVNPHRLWVHPGTDCYLVGSDVSAAFVRRFDPDAHVVVTPPPVRPAFYAAPSRADARARLGVDPDAPVALLMAGAWGLAPLADLAAALSSAGVTTLAVAGRNATLERQLLARAQADPRLRSFGFTDDVPALMAAADVVVTTPGDTCSEARVVGRRLVLLDVLAGHGRENLQHELEQGDAAVAGPDPALLPAIVRRSLAAAGDPQPQAWRARQWQDAVDRAVGAGIDPAAGDGARTH
jgi:UDP-N-acetylglucosamine:LPS N-acetylglucosamine transferase